MIGKKLISFLSVLSPNELDLFSKFLLSPYFNEQNDLTGLFEFIKPKIKQNTKIPTKEAAWTHLYPSKKYNDVSLRKLVSALLNLAISFKSYELLKQQPEQKLLLELKAVSRPELNIHISGINRKLKKLLTQDGQKSAESHFYAYEFEAQNHRILEQSKDLKKILQLENIQKANHHLDVFYFSKKLEIFADALGYKGFTELPQKLSITQSFIDNVKQSPHLKEPEVQVYYLIILMLSFPEDNKNFFSLKSWLQTNSFHFNKTQNKTYYIHLLNFCIQQRINTGAPSFYKESFDIFKILVDEELIFEPYIEPSFYRNIITNGVRLKAYNYVQNFIKKYSKLLPPDQKENAETYNLARLYYAQKKYDAVVGLLHNVELTNISYALGAKTILVGTYYALDEIRALESLLISFRIYVLRNKLISSQAKQACLNFLKLTKKLVYIAPFDIEARIKLKEKVINTQNLMSREWLLEQLTDTDANR